MKKTDLTKEQLMRMSREELVSAYLESLEESQRQQEQIDRLTEDFNQMKAMLFSSKSEKKKADEVDGQISMEFNEAEAAAPKDEAEEQITIREHTRSVKKAGKKEADLSKLPREVVTHSIPEEKLKEIFPNGWKQLPDGYGLQRCGMRPLRGTDRRISGL